jgi:hypothetical protein
MQTVENTPDGWSGVITELESKHASAMTHIEQLRQQKHELALDASLGSEEARKRLSKINGELNRLSLDIDDPNTAIRAAAIRRKAPTTLRPQKPRSSGKRRSRRLSGSITPRLERSTMLYVSWPVTLPLPDKRWIAPRAT